MPEVPLLELRGVDAAYGPIVAVRGVDLRIEAGSTTALLGRNGAGKSTILKLLAGLHRPTAGTVLCDCEDIGPEPAEARLRRGIALVPEGRGLFPGLTVDDNLRVGAYVNRPGRARLTWLLDQVYEAMPPISRRRSQLAGSLSGGEQQMVAVGRALMSEPRVLLLDEPSLGLAPLMIETLYELLGGLADGRVALVLVEQYVDFALRLCQQVIGLDKGRVVIAGPSRDVARDGDLARLYLGRSADAEILAEAIETASN